ncbi:hypothetical protein DFJ74DRAFT_700997 [Hyaloraphidium curvatum]|nr:hypothetical protein DFJ74DRAFT_700997 [Hyaloraphidium curvatum]
MPSLYLAPGRTATPSLPAGWLRIADPSTGERYYVHTTVTPAITQWEAPEAANFAAPACPPPKLPRGWCARIDPATGREFFVCTLMEPAAAQWERPAVVV